MITAFLDGVQTSQAEVQAWEDARAHVVMGKFQLDDSGMTLAERKAALLSHKMAMNHAEMRHFLRVQLFLSGLLTLVLSLISGTKRAICSIELVVSRGSAEQFKTWFEARVPLDDQASMIAGCPDHYIIDTDPVGRQVVVETIGGAPFTSEIAIAYGDTSGLVTQPDPSYPLQIFGVAHAPNGRPVGGVRHQLRQEGEGFRALITAELPSATFGSIIRANRWHLACEFSNWIEASQAAGAP